jgi:hypothetical protein
MALRFLSGLVILPVLAPCPVTQHQATLRSLTAPLPPTYEWPHIPERPDGDHPAHGEESGELPFSVGIAASGINTNVAAQTVWFHNDFTPTSPEFFAERYVMRPSPASNLEIRVESQTNKLARAAMPRRTIGSRSGR